jgi:hypothetical protein
VLVGEEAAGGGVKQLLQPRPFVRAGLAADGRVGVVDPILAHTHPQHAPLERGDLVKIGRADIDSDEAAARRDPAEDVTEAEVACCVGLGIDAGQRAEP